MCRLIDLCLPRAWIGAAQAHHGPTVVATGLENVDLIAAVGPHLRDPHLVRGGMLSKAQYAAVPERIDLRSCVRLADEGVIGRNAAVVLQTQDLTGQRVEILCLGVPGCREP